MINRDLAFEAFCQRATAIAVQTAPPHIDGLNPGWRGGFDRFVIAVADDEVIANDPLQGREREHMGNDWRAVFV